MKDLYLFMISMKCTLPYLLRRKVSMVIQDMIMSHSV